MTLNTFILLIGFFHCALCASFSNVVVRGGSEVIPLEYINYGGPMSYTGPQFAQISAGPIETLVSLSNARPCVSPCVIANTPISGLAPIAGTANAQIVAYKSPVANVPIVLANTDDAATGYQYAYAVYDEGTGDKKTQSEQSDGSVVQGQYSFIQPDGFLREVIYTADDIKGFNAVVRTVAPEPEPSKNESTDESQESKETPCKKNEQLVEAPKSEEKPTESSAEITEPVNAETAEITEAFNNEGVNTETINTETTSTESQNTETVEVKSEEKATEEKPCEENPTPTELIKSEFEPNAVVSYSDIIDCIQSKRIATAKSISPLTYILVPAAKPKPC
ncbi:unnamed protein product [Pieris brassicae]|uniref:Cuticle protein n=1 Tax=Pieris brassicae TaxID=7116 RepID=A0A9P0SG39_PIEBR|nr:unnamed protein product [Pieris brassicae]